MEKSITGEVIHSGVITDDLLELQRIQKLYRCAYCRGYLVLHFVGNRKTKAVCPSCGIDIRHGDLIPGPAVERAKHDNYFSKRSVEIMSSTKELAVYEQTRNLAMSDKWMTQFKMALGPERGTSYIVTLLNIVGDDDNLRKCDPETILVSAMKAASMDLPVEPSLGMSWLIPRFNRSKNRYEATFQIGYKGLKQLALRSGKYKYLNVRPVWEGEELVENPITGELSLKGTRKSDVIKEYFGYLELLSGYSGSVRMTYDEIHEHGKKFSGQAYTNRSGAWQTAPRAMEHKTVLLKLLREHGLLTFDISKEETADHDDEEPTDEIVEEVVDGDYVTTNGVEVSDEAFEKIVSSGPPEYLDKVKEIAKANIGGVKDPDKVVEIFKKSRIVHSGSEVKHLKMYLSFYTDARKQGLESDAAADKADGMVSDIIAGEQS